MMKFTFIENADAFIGEDGSVIQREYGNTPLGNFIGGKWVLRDEWGKFVDYSIYRVDLANKYGIELIGDML